VEGGRKVSFGMMNSACCRVETRKRSEEKGSKICEIAKYAVRNKQDPCSPHE